MQAMFAQSPYELPAAANEYVQTVSGTGSSYQIDMGGTLDEFNTAAYYDTYAHKKRLLSWFQPNEYLVLENTGDVNVVNPRIVVNGRRNWHSADELLAGILTPDMTDAEKAMAIWSHTASIEVQCHDNDRLVGFLPRPPEDGCFDERADPIKGANSYYCGGCSLTNSNFAILCRAAGMDSRAVWMCPQDTYAIHCVAEVWYDGGWHLFDADRRAFFLELDNKTVASYEAIHNNPYLSTRTWTTGFAGDVGDPSHDEDYKKYYPPREMPIETWLSTMDMTLRPGEKFIWRWDNIGKYRCGNNPRNITPERPEGLEPYQLANGKMIYEPRFDEEIFLRDIVSAENITSTYVEGEGYRLHPTTADTPASFVYRIESPYPIVGGLVGRQYQRNTWGDSLNLYLSKDNSNWTEVWSAGGYGDIEQYIAVDDVLDPLPTDAIYEYYLKYEMEAVSDPSSVACLAAYFETDLQMAATSLPSLSVGSNTIVYSDESDSGRQVQISHGWQESSATTPPLAPASAVTPGNGQEVDLADFVKLAWQPAVDPDGETIADYHIQISPRDDFLYPVSPNLDRLTYSGEAEWDLPQGWLNNGEQYYWRVRAKDSMGAWSDWSDTFSFTATDWTLPQELALTGRWTFDCDGTDSVGNHNATLMNGASVETPTVGEAFADSKALCLDGDNDIATISIEALPHGEFSIAFWEYTTDSEQGYILSTGNSSVKEELFIQRRGEENDAPDEVRGVIQNMYFPEGMEAPLGAWHHHVITNSLDGSFWYIDGLEAGQLEGMTLWTGGTDPLCIGNRLSDLLRGLNGYIDDLQIYKGAMSINDALWLYDNPGQTLADRRIPGDANNDGYVNSEDAMVLAANWLTSGVSWEQGDFNGDGYVNDIDATIMIANWQTTESSSASIPEPSMTILLIGIIALATPLYAFQKTKHGSADFIR